MRFEELPIPGAFAIDIEPISDDRGFFSRTFCDAEFQKYGLVSKTTQCSISFNHKVGTLRGMHFQAVPYQEAKLVRCTHGAVYDVLLDLRPESAAYCGWTARELSAENRRAIFIPEGVAHGFQTLTDSAEVFYQISEPYRSESSRGVRWDDPTFGIVWPAAYRTISERDRSYPDFTR